MNIVNRKTIAENEILRRLHPKNTCGSVKAVYSQGGILGQKPVAMSIFCCSGELEATLISNSSGQEGQLDQNHMCLNSIKDWFTNPSQRR